MSIETYEKVSWTPQTEEEKRMVRRQMHRLLETGHFKNSKRYPALFRFVVEETLEGRGEFLKERLLGVRVFDRPADYDTATDPIVRVTIAEIRKRIAQYYYEEAHETEMRIELLPGRYEPEFRLRHEAGPSFEAGTQRVESASGSAEAGPETMRRVSRTGSRTASRATRYAVISVAAIVLLAGTAFGWRWLHPPAIDEFWGPVLGTHRAVTFCLPRAGGSQAVDAQATVVSGALVRERTGNNAGNPSQSQTFLEHESLGENVVFSDVGAALKTSDFLATHNRDSRFRMSVATSLDDLRQGPAVLVGGLDNQWTMRAVAPLRFRFAGSDREGFWIEDAKDKQKKDWGLDLKTQWAVVNRDYAIIARVHDGTTGELEVVVAGIGMSGTAAAGEFLADPQQLEELRRRVGPGFRDHDFEAVLSTDVVNGISGSPKIITVAVW